MQKQCDICGRSETNSFALSADGFVELEPLETDEDDLWICGNCRTRAGTAPAPSQEIAPPVDKMTPLVGKGAGAICMTLNLPYRPPYRSVIDAASQLQDGLMSAWTLFAVWSDATTVWRAPDGTATAVVTAHGSLRIEHN